MTSPDYSRSSSGQPVVLGFALGNGWFRGRLTWSGARALYGDRLGAIAALVITYEDGHQQVVRTDESWTARAHPRWSPMIFTTGRPSTPGSPRMPGCVRDSPMTPGAGSTALDFDADKLVEYVGPPVVRQEELRPVKIWQSPDGKTLIDFGQNLVGWLKFSVRGERGQTITLRHAEVLEHGELGVRPLRTAKCTDELILSGGEDFFEPTFTFHGFRYAEITGWPGELTEDSLVAVVVSSELERIGEFECSDPMLNQLHTQRGLGSARQLPRRAERLPAARRAAGLDR